MSKQRKARRAAARSGDAPTTPARPLWSRLIFLLALIGVLLTVHLWIQTQRGFDRGCLGLSPADPTVEVGCSVVTGSDAGSLLGMSNVVWGFLFYAFVAGLTLFRLYRQPETARELRKLGLYVTGTGVLYVLYLLYQQAFVLGEWCVLCLISAAVTATLFGLHLYVRKSDVPAHDTDGVLRETGWYALGTFAIALLLIADVFFLNNLGLTQPDLDRDAVEQIVRETVPQVVAPEYLAVDGTCRVPADAADLASFDDFIADNPLRVGDADAPITVMEVIAPNCPHCKSLHTRTQAAKPMLGSRVATYYVPLPLRPQFVPQSQALFLAAEAGKLSEMLDAQFAQQNPRGLSQDQLGAIAEDIGMDANRFRADLRGGKYRREVQDYATRLQQVGLTRVPQLFVNGKHLRMTSALEDPDCLGRAILSAAAAGA